MQKEVAQSGTVKCTHCKDVVARVLGDETGAILTACSSTGTSMNGELKPIRSSVLELLRRVKRVSVGPCPVADTAFGMLPFCPNSSSFARPRVDSLLKPNLRVIYHMLGISTRRNCTYHANIPSSTRCLSGEVGWSLSYKTWLEFALALFL